MGSLWRGVLRVLSRLSLAGLALLLLLAGASTDAHAAFPGLNGQIGFSIGPTPDLFAINSDGTKLRSVITRPGDRLVTSDDPIAQRITGDLVDGYLGSIVLGRRAAGA